MVRGLFSPTPHVRDSADTLTQALSHRALEGDEAHAISSGATNGTTHYTPTTSQSVSSLLVDSAPAIYLLVACVATLCGLGLMWYAHRTGRLATLSTVS